MQQDTKVKKSSLQMQRTPEPDEMREDSTLCPLACGAFSRDIA